MAKRRTGIDPLAYMGVEPSTPAQFVIDNRDPTTTDYDNFNLQTVWLNKSTQSVWMLVDKANFIATWIQFTSNISGLNTLTGNVGGAISPTAGNINTIGSGPYIISGNPGTSTLTLSDDGTVSTSFVTDSGTATPSAGVLDILGGNNITTTGVGNTVTVDVTGTTDHAPQIGNATGSLSSLGPMTTGELMIGVTGSDPNLSRLTAGSNITIDDTSIPGEIMISSTGGSGGSGIIAITKFTSSDTWTKNASTTQVGTIVWNGGGGGGSGRQGLSTQAGGGGGGAGGGVCVTFGPAALFGATETVTIGAGGSGGMTQTGASTNGNPGALGGISSIGNIRGGAGQVASGGVQAGNAFGGSSFFSTIISPSTVGSTVQGGVNGSLGSAMYGIGGPISPPFDAAATGGGGGAGADSVTPRSGSNGIPTYQYGGQSTPAPIISGGTGGIEGGTIDGGNGTNFISTTGGRIAGATGGGGGGGQSSGLVAGIGGNGGAPGGGGGGGGGSLNGTDSGAGGDGGRGEVWVIEYY